MSVETLTRGQLAHETGTDVETIRFYERRGLLEMPARNASNYRQYAPEAVSRLQFIRKAKGLGFSLKEIRELLAFQTDPGSDRKEVLTRVRSKLAGIDEKISELSAMREALSTLACACESRHALEPCPVIYALNSKGENL